MQDVFAQLIGAEVSADKLFSKLENRQSDIMDDFLGSWEAWRAEAR
jgi:hypothetical protein